MHARIAAGFRWAAIAFAPLLVALLCTAVAQAATYTWTGSASGNWSNGANWDKGTAPVAGSTLVFPAGASNLSTTNDLSAGISFAKVTLSGSGYTLAGNAIVLAGTLTDSSTSGSNTIALNMSIAATRSIVVTNAAETLTLSGAISGAGGLTKTYAGTLVLAGTNTFAGVLTVSTGTLSVSSDANLGAAPATPTAGALSLKGTLATTASFTINANRGITYAGTLTLDIAPSTTLTYAGAATGTAIVTKADTGTLVLAGTSTNTGAYKLTGGVLRISSDANLGTPPTTAATKLYFSGGELDTTATMTLDANRNMSFTTDAVIDVAPGTTLTYGGKASGSGDALTLPDTGTLALTGTNTFSGNTNVNAGTLLLGSTTAISNSSNVIVLGTLDLDGLTHTIGSLAGSGTVTNSNATAATLSTNADNASTTFSGVIQDGAGTTGLTKLGSGILTLTGHNTYTGATGVSAGTLQVGAANAIPSATDVVGSSSGTLDLNGYSITIGSLAGTGKVLDSGAPATLTSNADNASTAYTGIISDGSGPLSLVKTGTGTLTLGGLNTYTGTTTVSTGTLQLGKANALPSTTDLTDNATFDMGGFSDAIGSLAGSGGITNSGASTATLSTNSNNASTTFSGTIADGAGTVALTKVGTGTLTLSGNNGFSGLITLTAGTLAVSADANLGTAPASATTAIKFSGGTLATTATFAINANRNMSLTADAVIDVAPGTTLTYGGTASGSGRALTLPDTGTLLLTGTNTFTGATNINAGTLQLGSATPLATGSNVVITGTLDIDGTAATTGAISGSGTITNSSATAGTLSTNTGSASATFSGVVKDGTGSVALAKLGSGTLTLTGANTYSGDTTITAGTLQIGAANALPTSAQIVGAGGAFDIGGFSVTIGSLSGTGSVTDSAAAATLTTNGNNSSTTYAGVISDGSGPLSLVKAGTGTLTLAGANTFTGTTTVAAGTLQLGKSNTLSSGTDVNVTGTLDMGGFSDVIGSLAGSGTVENSVGSATLNANGDNASTAFTGVIEDLSGTLSLTKSGTGSLTLSGSNTYSGATKISAGTLVVNGSQPSSAVTLEGGTLAGTGTVGAVGSSTSSGTLSPGAPVGILTIGSLNLTAGSPSLTVALNGATVGSGYSQLATGGTINVNGATLALSLGYTPANGQVFTIIKNTGVASITGTFTGLPEGATLSYDGTNFTISYVGGSGHDVTLTAGKPSITLALAVSPTGGQKPGTNLTYTTSFTNSGYTSATQLVLSDPIPANTDFEVGSANASLGSTGLTVSITYSNDNGATYVYTPVSGAGGAPAGYDRTVTNVRWTLTGSLETVSPKNTGSISMTARIR